MAYLLIIALWLVLPLPFLVLVGRALALGPAPTSPGPLVLSGQSTSEA